MENQVVQAIEELLLQDEGIAKGQAEVKEDVILADELAQEVTTTLLKKIMASKGKYDIRHGVLALARSLTYFGQYQYDDTEEYGKDIIKAREIAGDRLILALENPKPCEKCEACQKGERCTEPVLETENTRTKFMPLVASSMLEYDHWCKTVYKNIQKTLLYGLMFVPSIIGMANSGLNF
jgi:hypothetical protein